jgi:autotransporter-associated beta strand protein
VVLAEANTFTGQTVINKGILQLTNPQALLGSTLDYDNQGGTLSFGPLTSCTMGGLTGAGALSLTNTSGAAVALAVGYNGQNSTYSGSLSGAAGSLLKTGTGTITLGGSNGALLAATTGAGTLSVSTGGVVNANTANITGGQLQINGGALTVNATSNITAGSGGLLVNSGTASFNAGLTTDAGVDNNLFIGVTGGVLNTASLFIGRNGTAFDTQPAAGSTTSGLYVDGGTAAIAGQLDVCNQSAANSSDSVRIDAGTLTVGSTTIVTLNNGSRWSVLDINGGIFTSNDETGAGIQLGGVFTGNNAVMLVRSGVANTNKITFGDGVQTSGTDVLNVTGGALYIGAGGMIAGGAGAYAATVNLSGTGALGALANWSSPLNMTLGGDTIQAGDALGDAYNITLSGTLTGTTLMKTGNGTLLLSGSCSIAGATAVTAGVLKVSGTLIGPISVTISSGATFYLAGGLLSVSGGITNDGIFKISGVPSLALTGSFVNNGVLDLINGPATLPPNFVNNGTVLDAANINVQSAAMSGSNFTLTIRSYVQHTYQLQGSTSLTNPVWTNIGAPQAGTGGALQFTDGSAGGVQKFYQILVGP